jgi:uncharacterized Zn finger protein
MPCTRCAGLRVPEIICEGGTRLLAMRCIHCGDVIDRVIARNRCRSPRPKHSREGHTHSHFLPMPDDASNNEHAVTRLGTRG